MRRWIWNPRARVLVGIAIAALFGTWAVAQVQSQNEASRRDKNEVARMTEKMKTVCVGRFLIDLPDDAQVELAGANIDGLDISVFDEPDDEFRTRLADREAQLRAIPDRLGGNRNLESVKEVRTQHGLQGKIFAHGRKVNEGTAANGLTLERYRYENVAVEALVHGHGVSIDLVAQLYDPDQVENISRLVAQLVANPAGNVPAEPGFCIDRAFVKDPLVADQTERVMMSARLPAYPDLELMMVLAAGLEPEQETLLQRSSAAEGLLSIFEKARVSRLRADRREIGGLVGDELVRAVVEENDVRVYSFWWEVNGTRDDVLAPHLLLRMNTGKSDNGPVPSSLSQGAALGIWDRISSSIRIRQVSPPPAPAVEAAPAALGTQAWAGDRCPQSGWWHCSEGGHGVAVLGGQRQYIRQGERMPQALLLPPPTLWERMRGVQPSYESKNRTSWTIVDRRALKRSPSPIPLAKASLLPDSTTFAVSPMGAREEQPVQPGCFVTTGLPCPASGWWRCEESHALDGTRWFAQGSLLPPATFAVSPGSLGRSANAPKSIQRRGTWRLVRLADAEDHVPSNPGPAGEEPVRPS